MIDLSENPLPRLPRRDADSHKGDYGRAVIVGGSLGMAGAPALSGMACLRSGAGLTAVFTPPNIQPTVAAFCPAYTTLTLPHRSFSYTPCDSFARSTWGQWERAIGSPSAVAIGPGLGMLGRTPSVAKTAYLRLRMPTVIDADALNALAKHRDGLGAAAGARVLTPHAGEFARLSGKPLADPNDDKERRDRAAALARSLGSETVVLLKGPRTVVTDGERFAVNTTGNPGMATGGSGDVLTGIITALLAQGLTAFDAARLGAHVHGLAGDLAAAKLGEISLTAPDLIDWLPAAWVRLAG